MELKIKQLISMAGVKYAIHLGEECNELKAELTSIRDMSYAYGRADGVEKIICKGKLDTAIISACKEAFDVLWLVHHLGIAKYLKVSLPYVGGQSQSVSGKITVTEDGPYLGDEGLGVLQQVLRFRNVLLVDKAFNLVRLMVEDDVFESIYNEWVSDKVARGWKRSDYYTSSKEFDFLHSRWVIAFGVERNLEGRSDSEYFIDGIDLNSKVQPYRAMFTAAVAPHKPKHKWVVDKNGFLQRRDELS